MQIAVLPNYQAEGVKEATETVRNILCSLGADVLLPGDTAEFPPSDCDRLIAASDVVVALGGDGTIIHAAKHAAQFHRAVLGINCGHLGFMAGVEPDELSRLSQLMSKDYHVESRMMLDITLHTKGQTRVYRALNEAVISRGNLSRMISVQVSNGDRPVTAYRADGVIVATPTGSTAYSLSAGGPIIDPAVNCLLLTPICPHSLHSRSYIFDENAVLTVSPLGDDREMYLTVDGEEAVRICREDRIEISRSTYTASVIQLQPSAFYETLNRKLIDR